MSSYMLKVGEEDKERLDIQSLISESPLVEAAARWKENGLLPVTFENKTLLDFGCGVGSARKTLSNLFPEAAYIGLDQSEESIECARRAFPNDTFIVGDQKCTTTISQADIVFVRFVVMHQADPEGLIRDILTAMNPGALLLIYDPYTDMDAYISLEENHPILAAALKARLQFKFALGEKKGVHNLNYAPNIVKVCGGDEQVITLTDLPLSSLRDLFTKGLESIKDDLVNFGIVSMSDIEKHISVIKEADGSIPVYLGTAYLVLSRKA